VTFRWLAQPNLFEDMKEMPLSEIVDRNARYKCQESNGTFPAPS
jgi:hypothetical protein